MTVLAGILRTEDFTLVNDVPVTDMTSAVNAILARYQEEGAEARRLFVQEQTTARTERILSGGVDEGQELGPDGRPLETRPAGLIEVGYPWRRIGWAFGGNSETLAAMTVAEADRNVAMITGGNAKRHMREINRAFYNNDNFSVTDDEGTFTVRRLANGDGTDYAPTVNSDDEADDDHYLVSGYVSADISATNNPFVTLADEIKEHFSTTQTVVAFINSAQRNDVLTGLPNFVDADVDGITRAAADAAAAALGGADVPGDFLGIDGDSGVYVYAWSRTPAGYISAFAADQPAPLKLRVPKIASLQGFQLEAEEDHDPMWKRTYRDRFGYGVANRLGAAVLQLKASGTYDVPAAYA